MKYVISFFSACNHRLQAERPSGDYRNGESGRIFGVSIIYC